MTRKPREVSGVQGDDWELDEGFYVYHVDHVRRRLRKLGIAGADADDLVQQTFFVAQQCWQQRPAGDGRQRSWLVGIAWRVGMNFRRLDQGRQEIRQLFPILTLDADEPTPEDAVQRRQICVAVLAEMTTAEREMLCDYLIDGATVDEVAMRHGLARSTAWSKLQRLRRNAEERMALLTA